MNPQENVRQFARDNRLSNRIFESCDDIVDHGRHSRSERVDEPWGIMSAALREWAQRS
ncbi:MAG: hypothetical protein ACLPN5_03250 [Roseiarcus sp.]